MHKIKCVRCEEFFNSKMGKCPFCGARQKEVHTKAAVCPKCNCSMEQEIYRGSEIDICPQCNGIWLDREEFDFHTSERDTFSDDSIPRQYDQQIPDSSGRYLTCVRCNRLMSRRNFRKISGVLIDICGDHGVWLDPGELEQIRCFIANGGLADSQDNEIAKNLDKITRVAAETQHTKSLVRKLHKFNLRRILIDGF